MAGFSSTPKILLRLIHWPPQILYAVGLGSLMGRFVLLLTTTGRKSGKPRVVPLQYEEIDGKFHLGAARGEKSDWVRNIRADPKVEVRVKARRFAGRAEVVTDIRRIADFLEVRLRRHPRMIGTMLSAEGISGAPDRKALERYAAGLTLVVVTPEKELTRPGGGAVFPLGTIGIYLLVFLGLFMLVSLIPARNAARLTIVQAMQSE